MRSILFIHDFAQMGGVEKALFDLATGLDREQFRAEVLLFEEGPLRALLQEQQLAVRQIRFPKQFLRARAGANPVQVARFVLSLFHAAWKINMVAKHVTLGRYETVVTNSLRAFLVTWVALRLARARPKHLNCLHYILPERKTIYTRLLAFLMSKTDCLICNSQATLERACFHGITSRETRIIRQGFDRARPNCSAPRGDYFIVGSAGRLDPVKNYEFIIDTVALLKSRYPRIRVHIVGEAYTDNDRRYEAHLRAYIETSGMEDVVTLKGSTNDIWKFMDSLDVFMLASHIESFGRVVAEAMWSGRAIVAARVGAVPEMVLDGVTGYTFDPGDLQQAVNLLEYLITEPERAQYIGLTARSYAQENLSYRSYIAGWQSCLLGVN